MSFTRQRPIAPGREQIITLPATPPGHDFQILEIHEDLEGIRPGPADSPLELELHGPEGRGDEAAAAVADVLAALPPPGRRGEASSRVATGPVVRQRARRA